MSALGFGCAALLGRASRRESETAVAAALDAGITFFDTARSYGYGESEGLLGRMLAGRRDRVVICTKFGILPAAQGGWKQKVKPVARAVVKAFPGLRKAAQRGAGTQFVAGQFSVATLGASLETSLRALGTDYVDMLLMHGAPESAVGDQELRGAMERLVEQGKVRVAGVSAELPVMRGFLAGSSAEAAGGLRTAQFALNPSCMDLVAQTRAAGERMLLVANHPFGGPGGHAAGWMDRLRGDGSLPVELREKLVAGDAQVLPEVVLGCILSATGVSAVVPAMMQPRHIAGNVRAVEECRFSAGELELLRGAMVRME